MNEHRVEGILDWLVSSMSDADDLVAARVKFEELATWLAAQPAFVSFDERDDVALDELVSYLAERLPDSKMTGRLRDAAVIFEEIATLGRRASYDALDEEDPQLQAVSSKWQDAVTTLVDLEESGLLASPTEP